MPCKWRNWISTRVSIANQDKLDLTCKITVTLIFLAEEKKLVDEVFQNAMQVLSEEDRCLPQVMHVNFRSVKYLQLQCVPSRQEKPPVDLNLMQSAILLGLYALGSYSSGPPAVRPVRTKSMGGFFLPT